MAVIATMLKKMRQTDCSKTYNIYTYFEQNAFHDPDFVKWFDLVVKLNNIIYFLYKDMAFLLLLLLLLSIFLL